MTPSTFCNTILCFPGGFTWISASFPVPGLVLSAYSCQPVPSLPGMGSHTQHRNSQHLPMHLQYSTLQQGNWILTTTSSRRDAKVEDFPNSPLFFLLLLLALSSFQWLLLSEEQLCSSHLNKQTKLQNGAVQLLRLWGHWLPLHRGSASVRDSFKPALSKAECVLFQEISWSRENHTQSGLFCHPVTVSEQYTWP